MKLIEYISDTHALEEEFEQQVERFRDSDGHECCDFLRVFDAIESRLSDIRMYRSFGMKDDDEIPEKQLRLIRPIFKNEEEGESE